MRKKSVRLTKPQAISIYLSDLPASELMRAYNVSEQTIYSVWSGKTHYKTTQHLPVQFREHANKKPDDLVRAIFLEPDDMTYADIAQKYDVSISYAYNIRKSFIRNDITHDLKE